MNKYIKGLFALLSAVTLVSCSSDSPLKGDDTDGTELREINVSLAPLSRTTIEYENIDQSHLVWCDGDQVAYVTDAPGDVCRVAQVRNNTFRAVVPASMTSGNIQIVYPVGDNEGKSISEVRASVMSEVSVAPGSDFNGENLPMTAVAPVSEAAFVDAEFDFPASVLRLKLDVASDQDPEETLEQVTLTTNEQSAGEYFFINGSWNFSGEANTIVTKIQNNTKLVDMQENGKFIYIVMNRGKYTGVNLTIKTSSGLYKFENGTMELDKEGRTLYRIRLTLGETETPVQPRYRKITSIEQLSATDDASYLIVCEQKNMLFCNYDGSNYYPGQPVVIPADGFDPTDSDVKKRTCVILPAGDGYPDLYSITFADITSKGTHLRCMSNFSATPGKLYFDKTLDEKLDYWYISFDIDGNVKLKANPRTQDISGDIFLGFNAGYTDYLNTFCTYGPDAASGKILPVQLYKLME